MADLGRAALVVSLGLAVYALVAGTLRRVYKRRRLADSARNALHRLLRHDRSSPRSSSRPRSSATTSPSPTSSAHTSRDLPTLYSLSAFWGGQEGSLLLWLLVLTGYGALAVALNRQAAERPDRRGSCR